MRLLTRLLEPKAIVHADCDLPCGVYDPAQARIEAKIEEISKIFWETKQG